MLNNSKFTEIDEEFICENCGKTVRQLGYSCRNIVHIAYIQNMLIKIQEIEQKNAMEI